VKSVALIFNVLFCLFASLAIAQSTPPAEPDMTKLLENVNTVAKELQANLADLETSIKDSRDSEKGKQVLDEMLASVTAVHKSMAEDSAIWQELDSLLKLWEKRRKETLQKSESNPAFGPIAKAWEEKIKTARDLRKQISTERANSVALIRSIESDREIVLSYYELGQADKAIAGLQKVSANLTSLNNNMQNIVKTASAVQEQQPIPQ
jgi:hypothetical protein